MKSRFKEDAETVFNILRLKSVWDIQVNAWNRQLNIWTWYFKYRWVLQIEIQESVHTEKVFQVVGIVLERFNRERRRGPVSDKKDQYSGPLGNMLTQVVSSTFIKILEKYFWQKAIKRLGPCYHCWIDMVVLDCPFYYRRQISTYDHDNLIFPGGSDGKESAWMWETRVQSLGQEDPLKKRMASHSSILTWRIPCTEKPGRLLFMGSQKVGHYWVTNTFTFSLQFDFFPT